MSKPTFARTLEYLVFPLLLLLLATPAWSQEQGSFAKEGAYVGMSGVLDFTFGGETFDGQSAYKRVDTEEYLILPRLDGVSHALRAIAGIRSTRGSFEISYDRSNHSASFLGETGEATFHAVNFDERIYLLTRTRIQPHVLLGGSIPWLTIKDGSLLDDGSFPEPRTGDGNFRGFGVNTEAGVTVFPHPRVGLSAGYRYRVIWFDHATGVSETSYKLRPRFHETTGSFVLTGLFTF